MTTYAELTALREATLATLMTATRDLNRVLSHGGWRFDNDLPNVTGATRAAVMALGCLDAEIKAMAPQDLEWEV